MTLYFSRLAAAYVRGAMPLASLDAIPDVTRGLFARPLDALAPAEWDQLIEIGLEAGLRLHRFKRTMGLPRVRAVLGMLKGFGATCLLDVGSGRGAFLWPLLDAFPTLPVTALDTLDYRVADIQRVHAGGVSQLVGVQGDVTRLAFPDRSFDGVCMLETLEHIPDTQAALAQVCRVADRFVILSAPSKPDDNPEHIHLFDAPTLTRLLHAQGMARVTVEYTLNHLLVVARR